MKKIKFNITHKRYNRQMSRVGCHYSLLNCFQQNKFPHLVLDLLHFYLEIGLICSHKQSFVYWPPVWLQRMQAHYAYKELDKLGNSINIKIISVMTYKIIVAIWSKTLNRKYVSCTLNKKCVIYFFRQFTGLATDTRVIQLEWQMSRVEVSTTNKPTRTEWDEICWLKEKFICLYDW